MIDGQLALFTQTFLACLGVITLTIVVAWCLWSVFGESE